MPNKSFNSASVNGSSQPSVNSTVPRALSRTGFSYSTLAIMTSSPASARSMSLDRWDFASWLFPSMILSIARVIEGRGILKRASRRDQPGAQ